MHKVDKAIVLGAVARIVQVAVRVLFCRVHGLDLRVELHVWKNIVFFVGGPFAFAITNRCEDVFGRIAASETRLLSNVRL